MAKPTPRERTSKNPEDTQEVEIWELSLASAPVESVTFYFEYAEIRRRWLPDHPLTKGRHRVNLFRIPGGCDEQSFRVCVEGIAVIDCVSIQKQTVNSSIGLTTRISELEDCRKSEALLDEDIQWLTIQRDTWRRYVENIGKTATQIDDAAATNLCRFLKTSEAEYRRLGKELNKLLEKKKEFVLAVSTDVKDIKDLLDCRDVVVDLSVDQPADVSLVISYIIPSAKWCPMYDFLVRSGEDRTILKTKASVCQWTGENWNDVAATLSVATPISERAFSPIDPVVDQPCSVPIHDAKPPSEEISKPSEKPTPQQSSGTFTSYIVESTALPAIAQSKKMEEVTLKGFKWDNVAVLPLAVTNTTPWSKSLSNLISLKSETPQFDNVERFVSSDVLDSSVTHICTPNLSSEVHAVVNGINTSGAPILPGAARCFLNGNFTGTKNLPLIAPLSPYSFWLCADSNVSIHLSAPKNVTREQDSVESYKYGFEVTNKHSVPINLQIHWDAAHTSAQLGKLVLNVDSFSNQDHLKATYDAKNQNVQWALKIQADCTKVLELTVKTARSNRTDFSWLTGFTASLVSTEGSEASHSKNPAQNAMAPPNEAKEQSAPKKRSMRWPRSKQETDD